ncbi:hypothetical protein VNO78_33030 [Psophocarpus tetragonolobus]|uniref:Uncharacterized protein n=1 Tax=Psophocarpus tetragonolobus TaxID=3891 RepID=A0AAN9NX87_PSOTE
MSFWVSQVHSNGCEALAGNTFLGILESFTFKLPFIYRLHNVLHLLLERPSCCLGDETADISIPMKGKKFHIMACLSTERQRWNIIECILRRLGFPSRSYCSSQIDNALVSYCDGESIMLLKDKCGVK